MSEKLLKDLFFKEYYFSDFYFFNVGYEKCQSSHRFGPSLRDNYIVHFVISGKGRYTVNDTTHYLGAGDFFLIRPNELVDYEADAQDPWEYYWIGFSGTKVKEILHTNGIGAKDYIGQVGAQKELQEKFERFMQSDFFDDSQKLANQAHFCDIFSSFKIPGENRGMGVHVSRTKKYSEAFLLYVENNYYREDLTIEEIAKSMYLHPAYFSQVIKEELGLTALKYLNLYRMNKASQLLKTTELSVEQIASAVGYQNRHSFTRAFKNRFQSSPTRYKLEK
ncbi:AraC family transcriptional regulator [Trichococcus pasteurii]|uniref:Helix turn helix arabinose operon control protein n=1 Tax=Trichococcus pasteurii TaxID=43064 RepID=A0A1W1IIH5_9LACT|nr:AraC family ligand binding domain-containing protein [Trichococcus pasteurii]SFE94834.1 AraC-type DNA-binding protein [Trichococcus pasteurii]SLM52781.1 helix turn helix arabinose operon control protein [Trichococcus pasteurii]SSB93662.1 helix turn helix arabinose operon control protein [Trichococcus pasteurii]